MNAQKRYTGVIAREGRQAGINVPLTSFFFTGKSTCILFHKGAVYVFSAISWTEGAAGVGLYILSRLLLLLSLSAALWSVFLHRFDPRLHYDLVAFSLVAFAISVALLKIWSLYLARRNVRSANYQSKEPERFIGFYRAYLATDVREVTGLHIGLTVAVMIVLAACYALPSAFDVRMIVFFCACLLFVIWFDRIASRVIR